MRYKNYGDKDFFEYGVLVSEEHTDSEYPMILCRPYSDLEGMYMYAAVTVDISDTWIDVNDVMDYIGMTEDTYDPVKFAIGCTDYYSWDNFGAGCMGEEWQMVPGREVVKDLIRRGLWKDFPERYSDPCQVLFYDDEEQYCAGIAFRDEVISLGTGTVRKLKDVFLIEELDWTSLEDEVKERSF